eukprot:331242-Rhodomonas_salina.1
MVGWSCLSGVMNQCGSGCQARARLWDSSQRDHPDAADGKGYQWGVKPRNILASGGAQHCWKKGSRSLPELAQ